MLKQEPDLPHYCKTCPTNYDSAGSLTEISERLLSAWQRLCAGLAFEKVGNTFKIIRTVLRIL